LQKKLIIVKDSLPKMRLDKTRIRETIFNLLDNSIVYKKREIEVSRRLENSKCKIKVKDRGMGMTDDEIKDFFKECFL